VKLVLVVVVLMDVEVCLVVVEGRCLLDDVCMSVFYGVSLVFRLNTMSLLCSLGFTDLCLS